MVHVDLRNQLARWFVESLVDRAGEGRIRALAAFGLRADADGFAASLVEDDRFELLESRLFEPAGSRGVRLRRDLLHDLAAVRWRAGRYDEALARLRAYSGPPSDRTDESWLFRAAATLFNLELFFEVHELLESVWLQADEPLKTFLQGLIQVSVGFHHHANQNSRGALALLEEGGIKLRRFAPGAYGVELAAFCEGIEEFAAALRSGAKLPPLPRLATQEPKRNR